MIPIRPCSVASKGDFFCLRSFCCEISPKAHESSLQSMLNGQSFRRCLTINAKADIISLACKGANYDSNRRKAAHCQRMMKNLDFVLLLDCYGGLLTQRQRELMEGYYNEDLSLAELAVPLGISRQAVHDSIRRGERQLLSYETQMGLAARLKSCRILFEEIEEYSAKLSASEEDRKTLADAIAEAAKAGKALL